MPTPDESTELTIYYPPASGVVIDLTDTRQVSSVLRELQDWQGEQLRYTIRALQEALIAEADRQGRYTIRHGDLEVTVDGPDVCTHEYSDVPEMLAKLEAAGLPAERSDELATPVTTWKVNRKVLDVVSKNQAYAEIIAQHHRAVPKTRRASVRMTR